LIGDIESFTEGRPVGVALLKGDKRTYKVTRLAQYLFREHA